MALSSTVSSRQAQRMPSKSSHGSNSDSQEAEDFVASLDKDTLRSIALAARKCPDVTCSVDDTHASGAYNVVLGIAFSDGVRWAFRFPLPSEWDHTDAEDMRLSVLAQQYILARTTVPIPAIHAYDCTSDGPLGHPYILMDFVSGVILRPFWDDAAWWATRSFTKETVLASIAKHMVALSTLTFDQIGVLDCDDSGAYFVKAHRSLGYLMKPPVLPEGGFGPFVSTHAYLHALLDAYWEDGDPSCGLLRMLIGALHDARLDGPPFMFGPPDFNTHNVMFNPETGEVTALIDWDGVSIEPAQLSALAYPPWLTRDWNPTLGDADPAEMHRLRQFYSDEITRLGGPRCGEVTRNSHVSLTLFYSIDSPELIRSESVMQLGRYVFGDLEGTFDALASIERSAWFTTKPTEVVQLPADESDDDGVDDGAGESATKLH